MVSLFIATAPHHQIHIPIAHNSYSNVNSRLLLLLRSCFWAQQKQQQQQPKVTQKQQQLAKSKAAHGLYEWFSFCCCSLLSSQSIATHSRRSVSLKMFESTSLQHTSTIHRICTHIACIRSRLNARMCYTTSRNRLCRTQAQSAINDRIQLHVVE